MEAELKALTMQVERLTAHVESLEKLLTAQGGERMNDLLTLQQMATRLRVSTKTVMRYVERGKLHPPQGTGRARRWRVRDLIDFGEAS